MAKDYYVILGVVPSESADGIRDAYRDLAKSHHPDHAGPEAGPRFRDIIEAYRVLSDPGRRAAYDRQREATSHQAARSLRPAPPSAPGGGARPHGHRATSGPTRRAVDDLPAGAGSRGALDLEVILDSREAARGVMAPVEVTVPHRCRACGGIGRYGRLECQPCGGAGLIVRASTIPIRIPPRVPDGAVLMTTVATADAAPLRVRLFVRVMRN